MFGLKGRQLFLLLLLVLVIFAASQFIPVFFHAYQFSDNVHQSVKFAVSTRKSTEKVRSEIVELAKQFEIPVGPKDIHITRRGPAFTVEIDYQLPVNLRVYETNLSFNVTESGEIFENDRH